MEADTKFATNDQAGPKAAEVALNDAKAEAPTKGANADGDSKPACHSAKAAAATKKESHAVRLPHALANTSSCHHHSGATSMTDNPRPAALSNGLNSSMDLTHLPAGSGDTQDEEQGGAAKAPSAHYAHPGAQGPPLLLSPAARLTSNIKKSRFCC